MNNTSDPRGAVLCIDHGTKKTGFAVTDELRITSSPEGQFRGGEAGLLNHIAQMLKERKTSVAVLGLPINMDGTEGPRAAQVRAFGDRLKARFPELMIDVQDERLSTKEAEELMRNAQIPIKERRDLRDSYSALVILQDWLKEHSS